jgi:hypothetical protein
MKKVFIADKSSYGSEFYNECKTLDELKRDIVYHEMYYYSDEEPYTNDMYTEELFKKHSTDYTLFEVELHDEEYIQWHEYDGKSWFSIEKKDPKLLSIVKGIKEE